MLGFVIPSPFDRFGSSIIRYIRFVALSVSFMWRSPSMVRLVRNSKKLLTSPFAGHSLLWRILPTSFLGISRIVCTEKAAGKMPVFSEMNFLMSASKPGVVV